MSRIVIAIGGNAILNPSKGSPVEQQRMIDETCREIAQIVQKNYDVVLTHGNGPQIGNILAMQEECSSVHPQPLDVCGAQTQGMLGYSLQQSLDNGLEEKGIKRRVTTILTQVIVDEKSPSFKNPTKPIGLYYPQYRARKMIAQGKRMMHDKKGYRRIVPSPEPLEIVEVEVIKKLVQDGVIVIAAGGGGVPIIRRRGSLLGVEAVIDKDLTGSLLASSVGAGTFLILTDVEKVALNFGKDNQLDLDEITIKDAKRYVKEGHFGKGSMEPKVVAAVRFIQSGGEVAIISSLEKALQALEGKAGTRVVRD